MEQEREDLVALDDLDVVVLEEHYADRQLDSLLGRKPSVLDDKLYATPEMRIARLNALQVATEVLALNPPGLQGVAVDAVEVTRGVNDRLAACVAEGAGRLRAFAALPTSDPQAAADEFSRCVNELGFVGAMVHGPTEGRFLDDPAFEPILARANSLGKPIYIHPSEIMPVVKDAYFSPYANTHPMFIRAGWGYTIETGTHAMRLVLSGKLDRYPNLRIILGHFGETIPHLLERIDESLSRDTPMKNFREVFTRHFYVTSSGFFSARALRNCVEEIGQSRVMFSIDAPYASDVKGMNWLRKLDLAPNDLRAFAGANARALLGI